MISENRMQRLVFSVHQGDQFLSIYNIRKELQSVYLIVSGIYRIITVQSVYQYFS